MISGTSARISAEIARQSTLSRDIAKLQEQVSTGIKLAAPSDDPAGNARLGVIRRTQADDSAYAANVEVASALATRADSAASALSTALDRANELVIAGRSATYTADQRAVAAAELRGIAEQIGQLATAKDSRGQAIFPDGQPIAIPIAEDERIAPTVSRDALFGSGAGSLASIVAAAADALATSDDTARAAATATSLDALGDASAHVAEVHGELGVGAGRIDARREAIADAKVVLADERTAIESTDIDEAVSLIAAKLNSLEAAQAVFAKLNQQSLFDLLG